MVVGHSLGALVAIEAALTWPDKVRALVLCAAAPRLPLDPELAALLRADPERAREWLAEHALSSHAKPAIRRSFLAAGDVTPVEVTRADFAIVAATDLGARIGGLACPVTWIDGADDRIVAPTDGRKGEIVTVPGVGHLTPIEAPAAIAAAVAAAIR